MVFYLLVLFGAVVLALFLHYSTQPTRLSGQLSLDYMGSGPHRSAGSVFVNYMIAIEALVGGLGLRPADVDGGLNLLLNVDAIVLDLHPLGLVLADHTETLHRV